MKKIFSLLKAVLSQDMNLFVYKSKRNASTIKKAIIPTILFLLVMYAIGSMYLPIAMELNKTGNIHVILSIAIAFPSILALIEGIYKSQGILFEAKDNDLLFSLPISKKQIIFARVTKLYLFQLLYSLMFVLPGIFIYIYYENPNPYFYAITLAMILLFPIIPTIIGCFLGFIIKNISVKFKSQKIVQTFTTFVFLLLIMGLSFKIQDLTNSIVNNANDFNNTLSNIYYPIDAYNKLLRDFNIIEFLKLLLLNFAFVLLFVYISSKSFFNVLSRSKEHYVKNKTQVDITSLNYKPKRKISSLIKKEFSKYFSSPVYMINTMFGLLLLLIATISLCINYDSAISSIASEDISAEDLAILHLLAPKVFMAIIIAMSFMTSITSSSVSLEGKAFNISKALPIKTETLLLAKILMSNIITVPVIILCDIIFFASFNVSVLDTILITISSIVAPSISATWGLIINLKYPKMDASSDSEVVKQSMSSMVSVLGGILFSAVFGVLTFFLAGLGDYALIIEVLILLLVLTILWIILKKYGVKRFKEIEA